MPRIVSMERLTPEWARFDIEDPATVENATAGQLVMLRIGEQVLFTPHTMTDLDPATGRLTVVARRLPDNLDPSSVTIDVTGPVGAPPETPDGSRILCVAENLGVAALLPRLRLYKDAGCYTIVIAGYPAKDALYWRDRIEPLSDEHYLVTADGTFGIKGPLKHTVKAICENMSELDQVVAVGPLPMLKATVNVTQRYDTPTRISLAAVIETEDQMIRRDEHGDSHKAFDWKASRDLDGHTVDFDALTEQIGIQLVK